MIRPFQSIDMEQVREIHERHFKNEFICPDLNQLVGAFVVEDEQGIICAGGIKTLAEVILITNQNRSTRDRRSALYNVLDASEFITNKMGINQLHAFIQDGEWLKHLMNVGFYPTKGKALVKDI